MLRASCGDDERLAALIDDGDVAFVLEHCDLEGDQKIGRTEVLPMMAMWRDLIHEIREHHASDDLAAPASAPGSPQKQPSTPRGNKSSGSSTCTLL